MIGRWRSRARDARTTRGRRAPTTSAVARRPRRVAPRVARAALAGTLALAGLVGADRAARADRGGARPAPLVSTYRTMPHYFPAWLAGPLHAIGLPGSQRAARSRLVVAFCAATPSRCALRAAISSRRLWAAIVLAHLAVALAPPLLSGDVFGYIGFARLESLHGLSPYAFTANAAPRRRDPPAARLDRRDDPLRAAVHAPHDGARAAGDRRRRCGR